MPSAPILAGRAQAATALAAIEALPALGASAACEAYWPASEHGDQRHADAFNHTGQRDWISGVHGGWERWKRGVIDASGTP